MLGPAVVLVETEVQGAADEVVERVDHWLVAGHHLRRERRRAGRIEFSRRRDPVGRVMRAVRSVTGEGRLGHVRRIAVAAQDTGTGTSVVRIEADRADDRRTVAAQGTAVAVVGTMGVVTTAVVLAPAVLLATPVAVLAGVGVAARGRQRAKRVGDEVERVLDAVDQRSSPTRLTTDAVRRVANRRSG